MPGSAVGSLGDQAIQWAESIGWRASRNRGHYVLDDWQKFCIRGILSTNPAEQLCALVVLILVPRQNGKNVVLEIVELFAFYVLDLPYILHTAHLAETSADHMEALWVAICSDRELRSITRQVVANGKECIYRTDREAETAIDDDDDEAEGPGRKHRIRFRTRSKKGGRGGSPQMVVFDEALYLTNQQIKALLPSLAAQSMRGDAPILVYTSSAPVEESEVLPRLRSSILAGETDEAFFAEWSAELKVGDGVSIESAMTALANDRDTWYQANPGMGVRISPEWVQANERSSMDVRDFLIERLGVVFDAEFDDVLIPNWSALEDLDSRISTHRSWALAVSPIENGPQWAAIGVAGRRDDGRLHVEWMEHRKGTSWVVPRVKEMQARNPVPIRVHATGPEGALIDPLRDAGVDVYEVTSSAVAHATGQLVAAAEGEAIRHLGQASLNKALKGAVLRYGADGAVSWSQRRSSVEITPLQAVTVALGGVPQVETKVADAWVLVD